MRIAYCRVPGTPTVPRTRAGQSVQQLTSRHDDGLHRKKTKNKLAFEPCHYFSAPWHCLHGALALTAYLMRVY